MTVGQVRKCSELIHSVCPSRSALALPVFARSVSTPLRALDTAALLSPAASADDSAFISEYAQSLCLSVTLDRAVGQLSVNDATISLALSAPSGEPLAQAACSKVLTVGAYSTRRNSHTRLGLELTPSCSFDDESVQDDDASGVRMLSLTYSAKIAFVGGLPLDAESAQAVPILRVSLTYVSGEAVPTEFVVARLDNALAPVTRHAKARSPSWSSRLGAFLSQRTFTSPPLSRQHHGKARLRHAKSGRRSHSTLRRFLRSYVILPLESITARVSSLALGLTAMAGILWLVWNLMEARREGAIRLREEEDEQEMEEEVWVITVDKV